MKKSRIFMAAALVLAVAGLALAINESEPNDARIQANAFTVGDTLTGGLPGGFGSDSALADYWSFSATGGVQYTFTASSNGSVISPLDLALDIENSGGSIIAQVDNTGDNQNEVLVWVAPSSGTFYLIVWEATATPNGIATYNVATSSSAGPPSNVPDWSLY